MRKAHYNPKILIVLYSDVDTRERNSCNSIFIDKFYTYTYKHYENFRRKGH